MPTTSSDPSAVPVPPRPPGPKPRVPLVGLLRLRRRGLLNVLADDARDYGDYVFFKMAGRPFCLVTDPEAVRRIVVTDNALFTKSHTLAGVKNALGDGLLTADGELHKTQRRMIAPVFHAQKVKAYADDFVAQARRLTDGWRDGQAIDVGAAMTELTLRVVTKSLFDTELEAEIRPIGRDMATIVGMFERVRNPIAFILEKLPLPSNRRFRAALGRLDERIAGMIHARQAEIAADPSAAGDRFDLLSLLLMARDAHEGGGGGGGVGMSEKQVRDEAVTLFMAGHETTANALIWTWLQLAENPAAERALHDELDAVLPGGRPLTADDVPKLRYTRAVVAESMRLRPPAWTIARLCGVEYDVGPYRVPAGTTLLMPQFIVHHDPRWWPEPERFRPERWLEDPGDRPKYAYFPFGGGPRSCVGEPFAWLEAIALMATMAQRWRLGRDDATPVKLFPTITLRPKGVVLMTPHARGTGGVAGD